MNYQLLLTEVSRQMSKEESSFKDYDRNHVFFDILKFVAAESPEEVRMDMYYLFNSYQRIIEHSRNEKPQLAQFWVDKLSASPITFSSKAATEGMNCLYYPAVAFYAYKQQDYADALRLLHLSFNSIDKLYALGFTDAGLMKIEQKLNEFRIYSNTRDIPNAKSAMLEILEYCVTDTTSGSFPIPISGITRNQEEIIGLFNYCYDALFFKRYRIESFGTDLSEPLFSEINEYLEQLMLSSAFSYLKAPLQAVNAIMKKDTDSFLRILERGQLLDDRLPSMMRYIFLVCLVQTGKQSAFDTTPVVDAFQLYNKQHLKLPDVFVELFYKIDETKERIAS